MNYTLPDNTTVKDCKPFGFMTPSADWCKSLYNADDYLPLRRICHDSCVTCGTRDWILFERLDAVQDRIAGRPDYFRFMFGGLSRKRTVCMCLNCSLEARIHFWDRRMAERLFTGPLINTCIYKDIKQYYNRAIRPITPETLQARRDSARVISRTNNLIAWHMSYIKKLLGDKCTRCSQDTHLHIDCKRTQLVGHSGSHAGFKRVKFYYHQLQTNNLQLLCPECHARKSSLEKRIFGMARRIFCGKAILIWLQTNAEGNNQLTKRMLGRPITHLRIPQNIVPIRCGLAGCGHARQFMWLLKDDAKQLIIFACEKCVSKYRKATKVALILDQPQQLKRMQKIDLSHINPAQQ